MDESRLVRAGGALGHLLLVVVLALGVFMMHTVGHPEEASGTATGSHAATAVTEAGMAVAGPGTAMADSAMAGGARMGDTAEPSRVSGPEHSSHGAGRPTMAMDMMSLCVAVLLSAWLLAALVRSALARRTGRAAVPPGRGAMAQRPTPPPRGPDLTRLSVLRL